LFGVGHVVSICRCEERVLSGAAAKSKDPDEAIPD